MENLSNLVRIDYHAVSIAYADGFERAFPINAFDGTQKGIYLHSKTSRYHVALCNTCRCVIEQRHGLEKTFDDSCRASAALKVLHEVLCRA